MPGVWWPRPGHEHSALRLDDTRLQTAREMPIVGRCCDSAAGVGNRRPDRQILQIFILQCSICIAETQARELFRSVALIAVQHNRRGADRATSIWDSAFASIMAAGETEPMRSIGSTRLRGAEVCGRYIGHAAVEVEKTTNYQGASIFSRGFVSRRTAGSLGRRVGLRHSAAPDSSAAPRRDPPSFNPSDTGVKAKQGGRGAAPARSGLICRAWRRSA
jgi:hypothetical protein